MTDVLSYYVSVRKSYQAGLLADVDGVAWTPLA